MVSGDKSGYILSRKKCSTAVLFEAQTILCLYSNIVLYMRGFVYNYRTIKIIIIMMHPPMLVTSISFM